MSARPARARQAPISLTIDSLSHEGRGIGRHAGKAVFVAGALPGEVVSARVVRRRGSFDEAELVAIEIELRGDDVEPGIVQLVALEQHARERRLARAGSPEQHDDFTFADVEIDAVDQHAPVGKRDA